MARPDRRGPDVDVAGARGNARSSIRSAMIPTSETIENRRLVGPLPSRAITSARASRRVTNTCGAEKHGETENEDRKTHPPRADARRRSRGMARTGRKCRRPAAWGAFGGRWPPIIHQCRERHPRPGTELRRGEYEVVVLGGGPAGIAAAAAARAGRSTLLVERYGFLGGMGTAAGVTDFLRPARQRARRASAGRARHCRRAARAHRPARRAQRAASRLGKIQAQAYDIAAYKCAADDCCSTHGVEILFHAFAVGVAMERDADRGAARRNQVGARRGSRPACSSTARATAISRPGPARRTRRRRHGGMPYPTTMFRMNGVDAAAGRRSLAHDPRADGSGRRRG